MANSRSEYHKLIGRKISEIREGINGPGAWARFKLTHAISIILFGANVLYFHFTLKIQVVCTFLS